MSLKGVSTVAIRIWNESVAVPPAGMTTDCPADPFSVTEVPPNHNQFVPANGGPFTALQIVVLHIDVPKLVDVWTGHAGHGEPASNVPSMIT
jgi:hypothetical protein